MKAGQLYALGRRLTRIASLGMRDPQDPALTAGDGAVVDDLYEYGESTISEIVARTGLAQSYVSETVTDLRARGWIETRVDDRDRRRTLAALVGPMVQAMRQREERTVDWILQAVQPSTDARSRKRLVSLLEELADVLGDSRRSLES